jgi:FlaA1/EpsC-like NDP-sugar epimerase
MVNLIIIGAGSAGTMVANEIIRHNETDGKYNIIGFLDDDNKIKKVLSFPVLGAIKDSKKIINENKIVEVIIAIPSAKRKTIDNILNYLSGTKVKIKIVPGLYEIIQGNVTLQQIRDIEPEDLLGREEIGFDIDKISPYYKNKTIFITGAGGSIGSEILLQLLKLPIKKVIAFGHGENSIFMLKNKIEDINRFDFVIGDIKDYKKINHELNKYKPDIFFHSAAHKHLPLMEDYPDEAIKNNIIGTYNCVKSAVENKIKKFILISTDKAVNPTSVMGATKRIAEKIILAFNNFQNQTTFSLVRFGNVLKSRGSVVPIFKQEIEKGGPITITHKDITRYFMSIPEAARLVIKSASIDDGKIFILDMGEPIKITDLAKNLIKLYGFKEDEIPIIYTGLRKGEKIFEEISTDYENLKKSEYKKLLISNKNNFKMEYEDLLIMIKELTIAAESYDKKIIKNLLKKYIPEYISE